MAEKLILVVSTIDKEHNFLGLFDNDKKVWLKENEFKADTAEELFLIWKKMFPLKSLNGLQSVVINQGEGSFSGLRLESAIANSLKIAFPKLKLFSAQAKDITQLKFKVERNQELKKEKEFVLPKYSKGASIT